MSDYVVGNLWASMHKTGNVLVIGQINSFFPEEDLKIEVPIEMLNNLYKYARFVMLNGSTENLIVGKQIPVIKLKYSVWDMTNWKNMTFMK